MDTTKEGSDMQEKFNVILWIFIPCIFIFFILLMFTNQNKMQRYELTWKIGEETIKVTVFDTGKKDWNQKLQDIKQKYRKITNEVDFMSEIRQELNTDCYMIQINEAVMVGNRYHDEKYQVATTDKNGNLFQIIELEKQLFVTIEVAQDEFDKILIIAKSPKQAKKLQEALPNLSLEAGEQLVHTAIATEVYWLYGSKEVLHIIGSPD